MRQLLPEPGDVDPLTTYLAVRRPAPPGRPWVTVGMISTLDGGTAADGRSGALGGPADQAVLTAVRGIADAVLVGAGTVVAEDYGPLRHRQEVRDARLAAGRRDAPPRLVIVSGRLNLDPSSRLFADAPVPPLVCTTTNADPDRVAALRDVAEILVAGDDHVDLDAVLRRLRDDGVAVVVAEGGPTLNGALVEQDLVDEWCCTIAPVIVGGDSSRIVHGAPAAMIDLDVSSLLSEDGLLFGRWVRAGGSA